MSRPAAARTPGEQIALPRTAIIALMKAADSARQAMTRALGPFDLTLPQFNVLTILLHHDALPTFQVAAHMVEATPGITRLMSTLEAKRLVRRSQSAGDRRQQLCSLTPQGRRLVEAAIPDFTAAQQGMVDDLHKTEVLELIALLQRMKPAEKRQRPRLRERQL